MYYTKNQLQVAADSAALAGAAKLHDNVSSPDYLIKSKPGMRREPLHSRTMLLGQKFY